jgi:aminopeptidase YwaD
MINYRKILVYSISIAALAFSSCQTKTQRNPQVTASEINNHIAYLASDSLRGRYPASDGGILSGEYIHEILNDYGLAPILEQGYQNFKVVTGCSLGSENYLTIGNDSLATQTDFIPLAFSANAEVEGKVAFIGYGFEIESDNLKWNDYAMIDVADKWVMILREDPEPENMESEFIPFASDRAKATIAKDKGALGVLFVNGVNTSKKDNTAQLTYNQNLSNAGLPVISITRSVANIILNGAATIEDLEQNIIKQKKSVVIRSETLVKAKTDVVQNLATARNVVFTLNSITPSDQFIVIGAHYDHLGMGGTGVSSRMPDTIAVHNGADDNASGVAGIIELAGYLSAKADTLQKNIIFVAFDGEEMGLLGSKYFVENLPVEKEKIIAMLNFDMIGRLKHDTIGITIGGTGTAAEFDSLLSLAETNFAINHTPNGYGPSDHAPFYSENIPVLFFSTNAHEDYHTPFDDLSKIDSKKEQEILDYAASVILSLATNTDTLSFKSTGSPTKGGQGNRLKVTLGIIPDFSGIQKNGLGIDGVRKDGPAEKGGIIKGDIITAINGVSVSNIYDYMLRLSKLKPGTTAIVEIERNNKKKVLLIQL